MGARRALGADRGGGVILIDEVDAADPNVLLTLNQALANGHLTIPARADKPVATRHPDFVIVAAANTWGTGADREYVGRSQLDEAFLDRFRIGQIAMDYDADLERALCPDDGLRAMLLSIRERARSSRIRRIVSSRFLRDAHEMAARAGWTHQDIEDALFASWTTDEIARVR